MKLELELAKIKNQLKNHQKIHMQILNVLSEHGLDIGLQEFLDEQTMMLDEIAEINSQIKHHKIS